ncbi:2,4-dienoyl-CoA reductase-like NADH-dependent reductase (Old Yellow Enzyme family) [Kribbella amoyensis]|uniref:2,4-dienoyl-CoA reductase-like NADH-dependent reductase (Old Yellow Enzyme family) n=1 Tax=Kribbella amoyensis TaxID=996641 RepID=A0A561BV09_9ACTN|nr:NADH:flavin oxidoreductase [Kribbella amoyensis]TWD82677.1 2,4-dienoyl-CoA reductase-like NADH-dependent reductase (Old Yellow Enzyme family) [Kribbella amoyensis]
MTDRPSLRPTRLGHLELANRLAVAPMTRVSAAEYGVPTEEMADYYTEFAAGGFGLVITEGTYPDTAFSQGYRNQPGLATEAHVDGWRRVTSRVHAAGSPIIAQLMHAGALSQGSAYGEERVAPSAVQPIGEMMPEYGGRGPWTSPRELTTAEIDQVIANFVQAAHHAKAAGFDGVELHGANGYLLDQFLTVYTNQRVDRYGGTVANRIRFTAEIAAAVKAADLGDFVLGVRLSQTKVNDFEYRWPGGAEDGEVIFERLAETGIDYLHIASEGRNWIDTARLDGTETITGLARRVTGLPVIANGGMHVLDQAEQVLADGHADLLSIARGALTNSDLPRRWAKQVETDRFDHAMLHPKATLANVRQWRQDRSA